MVKTVRSETSLDLRCVKDNTMLHYDEALPQVKAVEQKLKIESSELINETWTNANEKLQTAGEMFLLLNSCPDFRFKSWSSFYNDLFLTQSADQIILTLNRMMKTDTSHAHDKDGKLRAEKLMKRASRVMSLHYEQIQGLRPVNSRNGLVIKDSVF